jgi:hypothetical protein
LRKIDWTSVLCTEFFLRAKGKTMTDNVRLRDSTELSRSRPIRRGSALYRLLEIVAAEIVGTLPANRDVKERSDLAPVAENNRKEADID